MNEQPPQDSSWLQDHKYRVGVSIATVATGLVAWSAPGLVNRFASGSAAQAPEPALSDPVLPLLEPLDNSKQVYGEATTEFDALGYAATLMSPTPSDEAAFFNDYLQREGGLPYSDAPVPPLREVAYIIDKQAFPENVNKQWGLEVYNATDKPIDVPFIRFGAEFFKQWIDSRPASGITVDDSIHVKVSNDDVIHTVALVDELPPSTEDNETNGALTLNAIGSNTFSWVMWGNRHALYESVEDIFGKSNHAYKRYAALGVEMCQSMLNLSDAQILPGTASMASELQQWINRGLPFKHDLTQTVHEVICNTLGRAAAAYWLYGDVGLTDLEAGDATTDRYVVGLQSAPVYQYSLATPDLTAMAAIKAKIEQDPGDLVTLAGSETPTAEASRSGY